MFYEAACQAIACAVEGLDKARERRRAEREEILAALQSFGSINSLEAVCPSRHPNGHYLRVRLQERC